VDLFAGCGGLAAGFKAAGALPTFAVEWDAAAAATYAANHGEHVRVVDIADVDDLELAALGDSVDVVVGGPPCQGFSNLGTRDPADPRNRLWREYVRVVSTLRPKVFMIENVDRFSKSPEFALLQHELEQGELVEWADYSWSVLNAADFGVPQRRRRTIVVASRIGPVGLPVPTHAKDGGLGVEPWCDVRSAIGGVPPEAMSSDLPGGRHVVVDGHTVPGPFSGLDLHLRRHPTQLSLKRYEVVPPGGGRFDIPTDLLPPCWRDKPSGTTDVMGRLEWDKPALTVRTEFFKPEKGRYLHPQWEKGKRGRKVNRPITHLEASLLQTFPTDYRWCGTKLQIARQIGNAVPPRLAEAIATPIVAAIGAAASKKSAA
jgi:DNA (cytosine-5)-methyltransferase 1